MASTTFPETMRASQWTRMSGGIDRSLKFTSEAALPKNAKSLPKDSTLVKVAYTTPNPIDHKVAETLPFIFSKPAIPCLDFAGHVVSSTLPHLKPGEPVFGKTEAPAFGACAEYVVAGKESCVPCPPDVPLREAACVGIVGLTAYQELVPFVREGDKVFINGGSGGVGTFAIQIAKAIGCHVTTTCSGPNVDLCKSLGADEVIDYRSNDVVSTLRKSGHQFDLVVDNVFLTPALYWQCHHFLKPTGVFVTIAGTPSIPFIWDCMKVYLWPKFLGGGQRAFKFVANTPSAVEMEKIAKWMQEGKVKAIIEKEFPLENAGEAFSHLKGGRTRGKVVIKVAEG